VRVTIRLKHSFDQVLVDGVNVEHKINAFYFWSAPLHLGGALPLQVHTATENDDDGDDEGDNEKRTGRTKTFINSYIRAMGFPSGAFDFLARGLDVVVQGFPICLFVCLESGRWVAGDHLAIYLG